MREGDMRKFGATLSTLGVAILFLGGLRLSAQGRGAGQQGQGGATGAQQAQEGQGRRGGPGGPPPPRQEPPRSTRIEFPSLFFREDWKIDPNAPNVNNAEEPEQPITQGNAANPNLEVHVYGDKAGTRISDQTYNNHLTYAMTLLCTSNCAITLRDKNNDVDLSGAATIRWRTRISGFRYLRPIIKLADGTWLIGDKATPMSTAWVVSEIQLVDVRWRRLDIDNVIETGDGYWVDYPDLSKVEEIGFTDLMRGAGHGSAGGSRLDWIEVYGKPVPRNGAATKSSSR
jgi:hypothetical protein